MRLRVYVIAYMVFLYAPILLLPLFAFNDGTIIAFPLRGFTIEWFRALPEAPALVGSVRTSIWVACATAILSTCLGLCAARAATRYRFAGKGPILGFIMLPLFLPEVIVAVTMLVVLMALGLPLGSWAVILGHTVICMPFCIAILNASFSNIDPALEEAAIDLGLAPSAAFIRVILPLVWPGLVSSVLLAFTISLDEFIIAFFLTGTEPTLPVYIWGQLRFPSKIPIVMALGTILVAVSIALLILAEVARRRGLRRMGQQDVGGTLG